MAQATASSTTVKDATGVTKTLSQLTDPNNSSYLAPKVFADESLNIQPTYFTGASQITPAATPGVVVEIKGSAYAKWFEGAMKQIRYQIAGSETALNEDEARLLHELYDEGTTQANYTDEVMGQFSGGMKSAWDKVIGILGYPMLVAERFNRSSLALAAFKAARAGQINNPKTLEALGLSEGQAATYEQAKNFAEGIVLDAHFASSLLCLFLHHIRILL